MSAPSASEWAKKAKLVGRRVLVPWPGRPEIMVWMHVVDIKHRFGCWDAEVVPPDRIHGATMWVRNWLQVEKEPPEE